MTIEGDFFEALRAAGLAPLKDIPVADGVLHRFRAEGDKAGARNGWYVLHAQPVPAGAFGSWKTGVTYTWRAAAMTPPSPAESEAIRHQLQAAQTARDAEQVKLHATAAAKAEHLWHIAKPATVDHPYLARKRVKPFGLRLLNGSLVIPARDADGRLATLQFIAADGVKRFLTGGRIAGCYCAVGRPAETLLIAEGYATAATLHECTGHAVACAFNAGNLAPVARALRAKFPTVRIVICADDDRDTPGNPGLTRATEAALAVDGLVALPDFTGCAA